MSKFYFDNYPYFCTCHKGSELGLGLGPDEA